MTVVDAKCPGPKIKLKGKKFSAMLVTKPSNIHYLTRVSASHGVLILAGNRRKLFLDGRYLAEAGKTAYGNVEILDQKKMPEAIKKIKKLGFEGEDVSVARLGRMKRKYKNTKFVQTINEIENYRRVKNPDELRKILHACSITRKILKRIPGLLKTGKTEIEIVFEIIRLALALGADGMAFDPIVAFGENTAHPHHHPGQRKFKKGDLVQIDMGVRYQGYLSDFSRVYFTGKPSPEQKKVYLAVSEAKKKAESKVRPGISNRRLDQAAREVLKSYGFGKDFTHALGHGVGLDIHEMPSLSNKAPLVRLKKNEVITIEPGVYLEGKWGIRVEDTIIVR